MNIILGTYEDDYIPGRAGFGPVYNVTDGVDWIAGLGGDDFIHGAGGDDRLFGGPGDDRLTGGTGADHLDGGADVDWANYGMSEDPVYVNLKTGRGYGGEAQGDTLVDIENLHGSSNDDILVGDDGTNELLGSGGNDSLKGGGGGDHLFGEWGDDVLNGGAGGDVLDGGDGFDTADYGGSDAPVIVSLLAKSAQGGHANGDTLKHIENLSGSAHGDTLEGNNAGNVLSGKDGDDTLNGASGADRLIGGAGRDTLTGGNQGDTFVWWSTTETSKEAAYADVITDFNFAQNDRIDLSLIDADIYAAGNQAFNFIGMEEFTLTADLDDGDTVVPGEIRYYHANGNTYIEMQTGTSNDPEGVICLQGIHDPQDSWFML
jgi:Ca2+-binding RTX toxin-like protein